MIFVTGPLFAGKQEYIMEALGWEEGEFEACAVRDVQDLAEELAKAEELVRAEGPAKEEKLAKTEAFVTTEELAKAEGLSEQLELLADALAEKIVVIATEVGGGVVPIDPAQRRSREAAGRLTCLLAERADTVVRVCCGLPRLLKGKQLPEKGSALQNSALQNSTLQDSALQDSALQDSTFQNSVLQDRAGGCGV